MVKADCFNPSHGGSWRWPTGRNGIVACVRCSGVIPHGHTALPSEPAHREWETTYGGPKDTPRLLCNQGITYVP
jgi:hypothetical protein